MMYAYLHRFAFVRTVGYPQILASSSDGDIQELELFKKYQHLELLGNSYTNLSADTTVPILIKPRTFDVLAEIR